MLLHLSLSLTGPTVQYKQAQGPSSEDGSNLHLCCIRLRLSCRQSGWKIIKKKKIKPSQSSSHKCSRCEYATHRERKVRLMSLKVRADEVRRHSLRLHHRRITLGESVGECCRCFKSLAHRLSRTRGMKRRTEEMQLRPSQGFRKDASQRHGQQRPRPQSPGDQTDFNRPTLRRCSIFHASHVWQTALKTLV